MHRNEKAARVPNRKQLLALSRLLDTPGRMLDVGCGTGNVIAYAERKGWEGWGIDFDEESIKTARQHFHLGRVYRADLQTFAKEQQDTPFSLVTFFDVIEHLDDHEAFFTALKKILAPGGIIVFTMPYRKCLRLLIQGDVPPNHLTRWDEVSTKKILDRHGFSVISIKKFPIDFHTLVVKLRFAFGGWTSVGLVQKVQGASSSGPLSKSSYTVFLAKVLARIKDTVLFGIPALILLIVLAPFQKHCTDLIVVAQYKKS
jgi:SAM-dependent methyltransferase